MALLPTSTLIPHLRAFAARAIATGRPRVQTFIPPPPARRTFERAPPPSPGSTASRKPDAVPRRPTNRQIPFTHVFLVDPETRKLSPTKLSLAALLAARQKGEVIELVASAPEPIVRRATRSEVEARYKEIRRALKQGARVAEGAKEVQLTWGVAKADVEHKLRKARRDLDKGYRVVVAIAIKRGHRPSSQQELVDFADEISGALREVGEEWKEREVTPRTMILSFRRTEQRDSS